MSLKEKRKQAKLSQRKLAEISNTPLRTIQEWEKDPSKARAGSLKQLASILDCTVDDFLP